MAEYGEFIWKDATLNDVAAITDFGVSEMFINQQEN